MTPWRVASLKRALGRGSERKLLSRDDKGRDRFLKSPKQSVLGFEFRLYL